MFGDLLECRDWIQLHILKGDVDDDPQVDERLQSLPKIPFIVEVGSVLSIRRLLGVQPEVVGEGLVVKVIFEGQNVIVEGNHHVLGVSRGNEEN